MKLLYAQKLYLFAYHSDCINDWCSVIYLAIIQISFTFFFM